MMQQVVKLLAIAAGAQADSPTVDLKIKIKSVGPNSKYAARVPTVTLPSYADENCNTSCCSDDQNQNQKNVDDNEINSAQAAVVNYTISEPVVEVEAIIQQIESCEAAEINYTREGLTEPIIEFIESRDAARVNYTEESLPGLNFEIGDFDMNIFVPTTERASVIYR